jgi:hypothetical protein
MTDDELANKFRECAAWGKLPSATADRVVDLVFNLERVKSIREVTKLLQIPAGRKAASQKRAAAAKKTATRATKKPLKKAARRAPAKRK